MTAQARQFDTTWLVGYLRFSTCGQLYQEQAGNRVRSGLAPLQTGGQRLGALLSDIVLPLDSHQPLADFILKSHEAAAKAIKTWADKGTLQRRKSAVARQQWDAAALTPDQLVRFIANAPPAPPAAPHAAIPRQSPLRTPGERIFLSAQLLQWSARGLHGLEKESLLYA